MSDQNRRPRWGRLYLVLPLAALLFWGIDLTHATGLGRGLLQLGALLIIFGYVDMWRRASYVALLHHPLPSGGLPLYSVREAVAPQRGPAMTVAPTVVGTFYSDLFVAKVNVSAPQPAQIDAQAYTHDEEDPRA